MNIKNTITPEKLNEDIDSLSKNLYLESPDLWIDFSDKMGENKFDEMVLFFATKYKYLSIVKHAVNNNLINLDSPSKNKAFKSIREHLISIAKQNNNIEIYNFLTNNIDNFSSSESSSNEIETNNTDKSPYAPKFICSHCNTNILDTGYISSEETTYKYSSQLNKLVSTSKNTLDTIICSNCKNIISTASPKLLESLCTVQNCSKCGLDLTYTGIIDKVKMSYDKNLNKFINSKTSYHCSNCDNELNQYQIDHFNL